MNKKTHFGFKEIDEKDKSTHVGGVFSSVAENYDIMNDAMSLGMHRLWKKILVELAAISEKDVILDIASGTGDIAKLISREYPQTEIYMTDINMDMLAEGRDRSINESFYGNCHFCQLSGEVMPKLGSLLANDSESYQYLAESIRMHPDQKRLQAIVVESGFKKCKFYNLLNGVVSIHVAYGK